MASETKDTQTIVMLISALHSDRHPTVTALTLPLTRGSIYPIDSTETLATVRSFVFRSLTSLRHKDGDDLQRHLDDFHQVWTKFAKRSKNSTQARARAMVNIFESDEVKGSFFLTTLPDAMYNVVDNLSTQKDLTFTTIEPKMLDLANRHSLDSIDFVAPKPRRSLRRSTRRQES
jgi:hypothetical protein